MRELNDRETGVVYGGTHDYYPEEVSEGNIAQRTRPIGSVPIIFPDFSSGRQNPLPPVPDQPGPEL